MTDVLIATSREAPPELVTPLAAALAARDLQIKTVDLGRMGETGSRLGRVVQALIGEAEAGRLLRELAASQPRVAVAMDPGALAALVLARDRRVSPTPAVGVVPDLAPGRRWAVNADRLAVLDDEAAVALSDLGVDGARVEVVGPIVPRALHEATREPRENVRAEYKLPAGAHVVLVDCRGLSLEQLAQLTLQMSLVGKPVHVLFDAGGDADAAAQVRRQVPSLGIKGKLFGDTPNAPRLWRAADVVVAKASPRSLHAARALGATFVALEPEGERQVAEARALAERGLGAVAEKIVFVAGAVEAVLGRKPAVAAGDGAEAAAEMIAGVVAHKDEVLAETFAAAPDEQEPQVASAAGDLEDLDDFGLGDAEPARPVTSPAEEKLRKEAADMRAEAERWEQRRALAEAKGDRALAEQAAREADRKRARMHAALESLAKAAARGDGARAAHREDPLEALRRKARAASPEPVARSLDDELAALKSKMKTGPGSGPGKGRP